MMRYTRGFVIILGILLLYLPPLSAEPEESVQDNPFSYDDHGQRDPFWPLVSPTGAIITYKTDLTVTDMFLEGIITDSTEENMAIINGMVVRPQDSIGLFTVEEIAENYVILKKGESSYTLRLKKEE